MLLYLFVHLIFKNCFSFSQFFFSFVYFQISRNDLNNIYIAAMVTPNKIYDSIYGFDYGYELENINLIFLQT